jgi:DNA-binding transcriptional regulator LsrR (DeoR family)
MKVDAVRDLIHRLLAAAHREGAFTESVAMEVERQWRIEYAASKIRVCYKSQEDRRAHSVQLVQEYLDGAPIDQITRKHGISRATLYRYLKK